MSGHPPSPALDSLPGTSQPATTSHSAASALTPAWATPADRQAAARDTCRASIATGTGLTGAALGKMFDRSPRWGVDRIAEVRGEADQRSNGSHQQPATSSTSAASARRTGDEHGNRPEWMPVARSNGNGASSELLLIGSSRNGTRGNRPAGSAASATEPAASAPALTAAPAVASAGVTPAVRRITTASVVAVALVAAIASYDHQRLLAEMAGEGWRAWLLPLSVDGLVVAASMSMLVRRRTERRAGALAWIALVLGISVSVTANVAAAEPTLAGRLVAAWPPVALLLAFEICLSIGSPHSPLPRHRQGDQR